MKSIWNDTIRIMSYKRYLFIMGMVAVCSYGFAITHPIIGIDDSAIGRYFDEGIGPTMGRYGLYLLNKILPISEYTPFIVDFLGVVLLIVGAASWCVVWERILLRKISYKASIIFGIVMISAPIISEVFIYYLHNGIGICYILSAYIVIFFLEANVNNGKVKWIKYSQSLCFLWLCNGFYEAFTVVFLMAIAMGIILKIIINQETVNLLDVIKQFFAAGILLVLSVILRTISIEIVIALFRLEDQIGIMDRRSVLEALTWFQSKNGIAELVMTIKQFIAMYYVNAIAYIPIRIYVITVVILFLIVTYVAVRYKKYILILLFGFMQIIPLTLLFIEGHATFYRNSQYIPIYVAFVVLTLTLLFEKKKYNMLSWYIVIGILVYNQAYEMTQWFYVDYMKYEDAKNTINMVSYELDKSYDTEKPVVFIGNYTIPQHIVDKMYVDIDSTQYSWIEQVLCLLDRNLLQCFMMPYGYSLSSEAIYSVFTWGNIAFEGWDKETHEFFAIHGHSFERIYDTSLIQEIRAEYQSLPGFPKDGSIIETKEYIVVKFE